MKRKFIFLVMMCVFGLTGILNAQERQYRIKDNTLGMYLHVFNHDQHPDGSTGGVGVQEYAEDNNQIFTLEDAGDGTYYIKCITGHYIYCQKWNVDAFDASWGLKSPIGMNLENSEFYLMNGEKYFKLQEVNSVTYVFCDAPGTGNQNGGVAGTWSLVEIIAEDDVIPAAPANLVAEEVTHNSVRLSWDKGTDALTYNVYRNGTLIEENISVTRYTDNTVSPETSYTYEVESERFNENKSETRATLTVTTTATPPSHNIVFRLRDTYGDSWNGGYLEVYYNDVLQYTLTNENLNDNGNDSGVGGEEQTIVKNILEGTVVKVIYTPGSYAYENFFYIYYEDGSLINGEEQISGNGADSGGTQTFTFTVEATAPQAPRAPQLSVMGNSDIVEKEDVISFYWNKVAGADTYHVYKNGVEIDETTEQSYTISRENVLRGTVEFYVVAENEIGNSEPSNTLEFNVLGRGEIEVTVLNTKEEVLEGAIIELTNLDNYENIYDVTDENGKYTGSLVEGNYYITVSYDNYESYVNGNVEIEYQAERTLDVVLNPNIVFVATEDNNWTNENNWLKYPTATDNVTIAANAVISENDVVNVNDLTIEEGVSVTINGTLTVSGVIFNDGNIILNDGAQLFQNNDNVSATFNMIIKQPEAWTEENTEGWQFISSPFVDANVSSFVPLTGDYDLYKYDGTATEGEWVNHKAKNTGGSGEGGNTEFFFDFEEGTFEDMRSIDADEDGEEWYLSNDGSYGGIGGGYAINSSCYQWENLYPENYIVTTQKYAITETSIFSFCHIQVDAGYYHEYISVVISEDNVNFVPIYSYEYNSFLNDWREEIVELGEYAGEELYIGLCHHNCNGADATGIKVDNVRLSSGATRAIAGSFGIKFEEGRGYLASYEMEGTASLSGTLNPATTFNYEVSYNGEENPLANLHLLGNPFTFNMDWENVNVNGVYDGYATLNAAGDDYVYFTEGTIAVGDGFFVQAMGENPAIGYAKDVRGSKETSANINVIARGNAGEDNVIINFAGEGEGFRKLQGFNEDNARIFVENEGRHYGIANVEANATEVELSFVAAQMGNYTISLDVNGEFETVTLVDRFTGVETNMLLEDEYSFTATSNDNAKRFVVRLTNGQEPTANSQFVYQLGKELILSIEGSVQIVDMLGRVVYSNEHANAYNRINVADFNDATYVVRVVNEEGVKTQKVVIY